MKPICLICARGGSKGVRNKNTRIIHKKPLIAHTIEKAVNSNIFSHVVVSTEDEKIAKISKKYGAEIPFIRPKSLALDTTPIGDVFIHAIKKYKLSCWLALGSGSAGSGWRGPLLIFY